MTLYDLTGHESGIIWYGDKTVGVCNWAACGDDQIPMLSPFGSGMVWWGEPAGVYDDAEQYVFDDIRKELPGSIWLTGEVDEESGARFCETDLDIVFDDSNDLIRLFLDSLSEDAYAGTAYKLRDGRIIYAMDLWV